jgi:hypothetical protein
MNVNFLKNAKPLVDRTYSVLINMDEKIYRELEHSTESYLDSVLLQNVTSLTGASSEWRFALHEHIS